MKLKKLQLDGFKSFAHKSEFVFDRPITAIVGPNGSGKSNVVEAIRFVLGEQSMKSLRGGQGTDLIFSGATSESKKVQRASVTLTFDNSGRIFSISAHDNETISLDFDEVAISREIYRDGGTSYKINGHEVRLKDIMELIASVNIGSSGHHIISQGEADRLLNANTRERRMMLEDALGLKIYQYRIRDAEKKLEKTAENIKDSQSLRREIAPHLRFLKKQVEKIERAAEIRALLAEKIIAYFSNYEAYLTARKKYFEHHVSNSEKMLLEFKHSISIAESQETGDSGTSTILRELQQELRGVELSEDEFKRTQADIVRKIGRLEGMIEVAESPLSSIPSNKSETQITISQSQWKEFSKKSSELLNSLSRAANIEAAQEIAQQLEKLWNEFFDDKLMTDGVEDPQPHRDDTGLAKLKGEYAELTEELNAVLRSIKELVEKKKSIQLAIEREHAQTHEREKEKFALREQMNNLSVNLNSYRLQMNEVDADLDRMHEDLNEYRELIGKEIVDKYRATIQHITSDELEDLDIQMENRKFEDQRRDMERMKIKLEEIGGGSGSDVLSEYQETLERDNFLEKEIADLQHSTDSLSGLISDLKGQLSREFNSGVDKINTEFERFFSLMFGGGKAKLSIVEILPKKSRKHTEEGEAIGDDFNNSDHEEEGGKEQGVEINVQLPRKKIQDLQMLSGGERSLTSIALLFALSQVNPPPFLVLDETDAALDEANSQKYGDMIEGLSGVSQLIVVTHNRETMSRADILYGVTLDTHGASKLLSVKFEEAAQFAK